MFQFTFNIGPNKNSEQFLISIFDRSGVVLKHVILYANTLWSEYHITTRVWTQNSLNYIRRPSLS